MRVKTSYVLTHSRSFKKAFRRIAMHHCTISHAGTVVNIRVSKADVWRDVLQEFKLNRRVRRQIRGFLCA